MSAQDFLKQKIGEILYFSNQFAVHMSFNLRNNPVDTPHFNINKSQKF